LRDEIDALNSRIYDAVNNGVYRAGFATTQEAYAEAIGPLFDTLDELDHRLATRRFLTGDSLTEADIRFPDTAAAAARMVGLCHHFRKSSRWLVRVAKRPARATG
jgi:glutathionyl-hydroquinone reductase